MIPSLAHYCGKNGVNLINYSPMVARYGYSCAVDWVLTIRQRTTKGVDIEWARSSAVEHLTFNQRVVGSDPAGLTNYPHR